MLVVLLTARRVRGHPPCEECVSLAALESISAEKASVASVATFVSRPLNVTTRSSRPCGEKPAPLKSQSNECLVVVWSGWASCRASLRRPCLRGLASKRMRRRIVVSWAQTAPAASMVETRSTMDMLVAYVA